MILIDIDMPKSCEECPCFDNAYGECQIDAKNTIGFVDLEERSAKCPIKCDIEDIKAEIADRLGLLDCKKDILAIIDKHTK